MAAQIWFLTIVLIIGFYRIECLLLQIRKGEYTDKKLKRGNRSNSSVVNSYDGESWQ